jgi:hypothetical protein
MIGPNAYYLNRVMPPTAAREEWHKRNLLYLLIFIVTLVRLFTETLGILPRALNFADLALFVYASAMLLARRGGNGETTAFYRRSLSGPVKMFSAWVMVSTAVNLLFHGIHILPALIFWVFHLEPIVFALLLMRLDWHEGDTQKLSNILVAIGLIQIPLSLIQMSSVFSEDNPDLASGTFGSNGSQMCFFVVLVIAYLLGRYLMDSRIRWLLPLPGLLIVFYAQGFKAMWLPLIVTIPIGVFLCYPGSKRRKWGLVLLVVAFVLLVALPIGKLSSAQTMEFMHWDYVTDVVGSGAIWELGKIQSFLNVGRLYRDSPIAAFVGVGPGSFSSRAFQTFTRVVLDPDSPTHVVYGYISPTPPGAFAEKYVVPQVFKSEVLFGSGTIDGPFNSYVALLAEVGIVGFALYAVIYCRIFRKVIAATREAWRKRNHELYAISLAAICGLLILFEMAFLDNWLETSRVTIPLWLVLIPAMCCEVGEVSKGTSEKEL